MFSNYAQYLLDYPSHSDEDDSDWLLPEGGDRLLDHHLDTELVDEESDSYSSSNGNVQEDRG
jgi:hypothetical protein